MQTVDTLMVGVGADITDLTRGLAQARQEAERFARDLEQSIAMPDLRSAGIEAGRDLAGGLTAGLGRIDEDVARVVAGASGGARELSLALEQAGTGAAAIFDELAGRFRDVATGRFLSGAGVRVQLVDTGALEEEFARVVTAGRALGDMAAAAQRDLASLGSASLAAARETAQAATMVETLGTATQGAGGFGEQLARQLGTAERNAEALAGALVGLGERARTASTGELVVPAAEVERVTAAVRELGSAVTVTAGEFGAIQRNLADAIGPAARSLELQGVDAANALIEGLTTRLEAAQTELREALFRGGISRAEFDREGQQAAAAFNAGILRGIERLGDRGLLTADLHQSLVAELRMTGLDAGAALAGGLTSAMETRLGRGDFVRGRVAASFRQLSEEAASAARAVQPLEGQLGNFDRLGQRAANASVAVAFGLEALARGGDAAETGLRTALRSIASLGAAFGPQGLIVSGVAASTAAMIDLFEQARDEAAKTRETFEEELRRMVQSAEFIPLQQKMRDIFTGDPLAGRAKFGGFFAGGLSDLRGEIADLERQLLEAQKNVGGALIIGPLQRQLAELRAQAAPLEEQVARIADVLRNPPALPRELTGLPSVSITVPSLDKVTDEAARAFEQHIRRLLQMQRDALADQQDIPGLNEALLRAYDEATGALSRQSDALGENATKLRALVHDLESLDLVRLVKLDTPIIARVVPVIQPMERVKIPDALIKQLQDELDRMLAGVVTAKPSTLNRVFSPLMEAMDPAEQAAAGLRDGLLAAGDAFGDFGQDAARALTDVVAVTSGIGNLQDALGGLKSAATFGDFAAAAGSLIGAIGSIVGGLHNLIGGGVDAADVQAEQELKRAMRENAEAVERLRLELERSAFGIDEQRRVGEGAAQAAAFNPNLQQPLAEPLQRAVLETTLQHFGVSLAEVERMAREYSIALFENGQYVVGSLEAVAAAAGASVENLTKFGDTLDGWARRLDVHAQIFDIDGPQQALDDAVKMLVQFSPAARAAFQGIDTTTEQGRAALEEAMRAFLTALENETIPVELFGLSIDQITQLLLDADGAMDELAQGARDAAGALTNVPPVFKLAQRRFEAMMEEALLPPSFTTPSLPPMQIPPPDLTPQPIEWGELTASNARLADVMDTGTRRLADVLGQLIPLAPVSTVVSGGSALHAAERAAQPIIVNHTYHVAGAQIPAAELDRMSARELLQRMTEQARTQARSQGGDTTYPFTRLL